MPRRGFALLDAIVGGMLLGVGLTVVLGIGSRALSNQAEGEMRLQASWLADELLSMVLVEGPDKYSHLYDMHGDFDAPFDQFEYEINIDDRGPSSPSFVSVFITWPGARSPIVIETYISKREGDPFQPREPVDEIERQQLWDDYHDQLEGNGF